MSPTFDAPLAVRRAYRRLSRDQRREFIRARDRLIEGLRESPPRYHPALRLKRHQASGPGVYELSFGDGGRALLRFGDQVREGMAHVEWLAIGGHEVVD
ncbi:MAG: hypothetical protein M3433_03170 [Actinomycetota bacterium]|nr:hypothetical protein [Actinomycetota bacterium]